MIDLFNDEIAYFKKQFKRTDYVDMHQYWVDNFDIYHSNLSNKIIDYSQKIETPIDPCFSNHVDYYDWVNIKKLKQEIHVATDDVRYFYTSEPVSNNPQWAYINNNTVRYGWDNGIDIKVLCTHILDGQVDIKFPKFRARFVNMMGGSNIIFTLDHDEGTTEIIIGKSIMSIQSSDHSLAFHSTKYPFITLRVDNDKSIIDKFYYFKEVDITDFVEKKKWTFPLDNKQIYELQLRHE